MYTSSINTQILISLLKQNNIRKIIASPGTMNINFVGSIQNDRFFEVYSCVDERSAAYMACGMAAESGETVCLTCTGATASRNYIPALTEAFYRKLPIITITATAPISRVGHNMEQMIDRSNQLNDMVKFSALLPIVKDAEDKWECIINVNKAIIETKRNGGGPVNINLEAIEFKDFSIKKLPAFRKIDYYCTDSIDKWPTIYAGRVGIYIGTHTIIQSELQSNIEKFCEKYNAIVFCDRTSNYFGKYRINPSLVIKQEKYTSTLIDIDLLIHIGDVSGSQFFFSPNRVWRVNPDGELRDTYKCLKAVFESEESIFFAHYVQGSYHSNDSYYRAWAEEISKFKSLVPELPFSNVWVAKKISNYINKNIVVHLGILNSLRSWDYFDNESECEGECYSNTGGFGIDGGISTLIGGAISNPHKLHLGVFGDLAFFYDINSLGNRHFPSNIRIILINNGCGAEFKRYCHPASKFGDSANLYMAAGGHFGNKSENLVKNYVEDLDIIYMKASSKNEFDDVINKFMDNSNNQSILLEIFTKPEDESNALYTINNLRYDAKGVIKQTAENILGVRGINYVKQLLRNRR